MDHNVPTRDVDTITDLVALKQINTLKTNCEEFGIELADMGHPDQGIVHIIGPELGLTQPGKTIVCGDSHTSTHGAFGAIAFGIGTSEVEHVLSTQTLWQSKPKTMEVRITGELGPGVTAKDIILAIIAQNGVDMGNGHIVEYTGDTIRGLSMEERMTICNMSIEAGAKAGLISQDEATIEFLRGRRHVPEGEAFDKLAEEWLALATDEGAEYDQVIELDASKIEPYVTWGTNPSMGSGISERVPSMDDMNSETEKAALRD